MRIFRFFRYSVVSLAALSSSTALSAQRGSASICPAGLTTSGTVERQREWDDPRNSSGKPAQLIGAVATADGRPVAEVRLLVLRAVNDANAIASTNTDSSGVFRIPSLPPGKYVLRTVRIGYLTQWHEIRLLPETSDTLCLHLRALPPLLPPMSPAQRSPSPPAG